jgi:hypothetical protein
MYGRKLLWRTAVLTASIIIVSLAGMDSRAEQFWTEGFESYSGGDSIHNKGTTWQHVNVPAKPYEGQVVPPISMGGVTPPSPHGGNLELSVASGLITDSQSWNCSGSTWFDDMPGSPHGGVVSLSWWMYVYTSGATWDDPSWNISAYGVTGKKVAEIDNSYSGSPTTIKTNTDSGWIEQTTQKVLLDQWRKVTLEIDLSTNPNQYRVCAGGTDWTNWLSLGSSANETSFGSIKFASDFRGGSSHTMVFYDDMSGSVVPEPSIFILLSVGAVSLLVYVWRRRKLAA